MNNILKNTGNTVYVLFIVFNCISTLAAHPTTQHLPLNWDQFVSLGNGFFVLKIPFSYRYLKY